MKNTVFTFFLLAALLSISFSAFAVHVDNMPVVCLQPNGDTLHCYVTGDEYYHRLHDAQGYTIVRNPHSGYYVYAIKRQGSLVPSTYIAGRTNPTTLNLQPNLCLSNREIAARIKEWQVPVRYTLPVASFSPKNSIFTTTNHGVLNNIVIFIRFSNETGMTKTYSAVDSMFNDTSSMGVSMRTYFQSASYNQMNISTTFYPTPNGNVIRSYQDSHARGYFQPYDSTTNPGGYQTATERRQREFTLMQNAVQYVNDSSPVPLSLNIDANGDGNVDNICFVVSGTFTGWSDLLWPHKWSLYDRNVYINNKRVYTYNLQLENSGSHYFSVSTFCHEMFHTLGAPDLYHYNYYTDVSSAGSWDLMNSNTNPPQHMSAFMKYRYGNWLDTIPEIVNPGRYTLHSMAGGNKDFCYRIPSQDPSQFYLLEYRHKTDRYEGTLPSNGLLIWRIDTRFNGNASFNDSNIFDEVYVYRYNGINDTTPGYVSMSSFAAGTTRNTFSSTSNPSSWLTGNVLDTTITINGLTTAGDSTFSFNYATTRAAEPNQDSDYCYLKIKMTDAYGDTWNGASLRLESSNGHLYGSAFLGITTADSAIEHIRVCNNDSIYLRWTPGPYPEECGFTVSDVLGHTLYTCSDASSIGSLAAVIPDGCPLDRHQYTITAVSSDANRGTATGSGTFYEGDTAVLTATPAEGYSFHQWENGNSVVYGNPLSVRVVSDSTFLAVFNANQYTMTATVAQADQGHTDGSGTYYYHDTVRLTAYANDNYTFSHWTSGTDSITANPYVLLMPAHNTTIEAHFRQNHVGIGVQAMNNIQVYSINNTIRICGAEGLHANVYDIMGRPVTQNILCNSTPYSIQVPQAGVYMVRISGLIFKVIIL